MAARSSMSVRTAEDWVVGLILRAETGIPYMLLAVDPAILVSVGVVLLNMLTEQIFRRVHGYPRRLAALGVGAVVVNGLIWGAAAAVAQFRYPDTGFDWGKLRWVTQFGFAYASVLLIVLRFGVVGLAQIVRLDRRVRKGK